MAKKRKRMSKEELRSPDKIEVALTNAWKWVENHLRVVMALIVTAVAAIVVVFVLDRISSDHHADVSEQLRVAIKPLLMPPMEDAEERKKLMSQVKLPMYSDEQAKLKAGLASIDAYLQAHGSAEAAGIMRFAQGSLMIANGKTKAGAQALKDWVSKHGKSPVAQVAMGQLVDANLALGKPDEARSVAQQALAQATGVGKALPLVRLGDLSNPLMVSKGDAATARKHYEAAQKILEKQSDHPLTRQLSLRLAVLP